MIWQPKKYQMVKVHYRKSAQKDMKYHGVVGTVYAVGNGRGPKNVLIGIGIWRIPRFIVVQGAILSLVRDILHVLMAQRGDYENARITTQKS